MALELYAKIDLVEATITGDALNNKAQDEDRELLELYIPEVVMHKKG